MREKSREQDGGKAEQRQPWRRWKDKTHEGIWEILEQGYVVMDKMIIRISFVQH